jgi:hypothetical protein
MDCLDTPAESIIIHDIVVDQRKGVREFKCESCLDNILGASLFYRIRRKHNNGRTEPFSSGREKMSAGLVQFTNRINEIPVDHDINLSCNRFQVR